MRRLKSIAVACAAICGMMWWTGTANAEVELLELYLYGGVTQRGKNQMKRMLAPYTPKENVSFRQMVREDGSVHPWVTVVEIRPNGLPINLYDIVHRIDDDRGVNDRRILWKTVVTASGELRSHFGFNRHRIGRPPFAALHQRGTPGVWNYLDAPYPRERLTFHPNTAYDNLRLANRDVRLRVKGRIAGFNHIYPIVVLGTFEETDRPTEYMRWKREAQRFEKERKEIIRRNAF